MKLFLLAATAMFAVPAIAQDTPAPAAGGMPPAASTPTTADPQQTTDPAMTPAPAAPATDGSMGGQGMNNQSMQGQPMQGSGMNGQGMGSQGTMSTGSGATPMGGYQPSQPAMQGQMQPGVTPIFQPAPSPSQAYPAPAPLAKYPICKKGQYDQCMQRGGK